jgi:hypothetical protein
MIVPAAHSFGLIAAKRLGAAFTPLESVVRDWKLRGWIAFKSSSSGGEP